VRGIGYYGEKQKNPWPKIPIGKNKEWSELRQEERTGKWRAINIFFSFSLSYFPQLLLGSLI